MNIMSEAIKVSGRTPQRCPTCNRSVDIRGIVMFDGLIRALHRIWKWCDEKGVHEFTRKEIKHLFAGENQIARFGDWVLFGGLVYRPLVNGKPRKGRYGLNMERVAEFFAGRYDIPKVVWKDPFTGDLEAKGCINVAEVPKLIDLLDKNDEYVPMYRSRG